jgi:hypothetical protein
LKLTVKLRPKTNIYSFAINVGWSLMNCRST